MREPELSEVWGEYDSPEVRVLIGRRGAPLARRATESHLSVRRRARNNASGDGSAAQQCTNFRVVVLAQARQEVLAHQLERLRQPVAELAEELGLALELGPPLRLDDAGGLVDLLRGDVEAAQIDVAGL